MSKVLNNNWLVDWAKEIEEKYSLCKMVFSLDLPSAGYEVLIYWQDENGEPYYLARKGAKGYSAFFGLDFTLQDCENLKKITEEDLKEIIRN